MDGGVTDGLGRARVDDIEDAFRFSCWRHRDKTKVQMPAKIFPHLKVKCYLFMGPALGFDTKQRNSFSDQIWCFFYN